MDENYIVSIRNLVKKYGTLVALDDVSLDLPKGKIIGLLGPNGSGKTTLIKILVGLLNVYSGDVLIDGNKVGIDSKSVISYLPDRNILSESWNFREACEYFKDFYRDFDESKAISLAHQLNIPTESKFKTLSKGTKEKLQLILALSRQAKLYVFDEPIAGADPIARDIIFKLIEDNVSGDASVLISTHLILDVQDHLDYVVFLRHGRIALRNDVEALKQATGKRVDEVFREVFIHDF